MYLYMTFLSESFPTDRTLKWFMASMSPHMVLKVKSPYKRLVTQVTCEHFNIKPPVLFIYIIAWVLSELVSK